MSAKIKTEHKTKHVETLRVHPGDVKLGRNSRMIAAPNYLDVVTDRAVSIAKHGQITPAEVRRLEDNTLELVYGFTRFDAIKMLREGFTAIDPDTGEETKFHEPDLSFWVKIVDTDPDEAFLRSIAENQEREETTDLQEALAQNELRTTMGWSDTKIARFYGYTNQNRVMTLEKLLRTPKDVQNAVHEGRMALSVAILGVEHDLSPEEQVKLLEESATDGKVNGPALKQLLRELLAKKGADLPAPADADVPALDSPSLGGRGEGDEEPAADTTPGDGKRKRIPRTRKDFERLFQQWKDDKESLSDAGAELMSVLVLWFQDKRTDAYLLDKINEYTVS